ncbi:MAG: ABC transporter permease [Candidatus Aminicenantes bacterium]|nr:ABC transporter permease [Candidatus Aminicenantes bacterium]
MSFLKIGLRNLFRQKRRTVISLMVIIFGVGILLLTLGHSRYISWGLREMTIHSETGHLQVFHRKFYEGDEETFLQFGLEDYGKMRLEIGRLEGVALVLARVELMGLISNGEKSVACIGQAVEPELEKQLRQRARLSDDMFDPFLAVDNMEVIALGKELASSLNVRRGDFVTLMVTTANGALNAMDLQVAGTFSGFSPEYEARAILMPLQTASILLNTKKVRNLIVALEETSLTESMAGRVNRLLQEKGYQTTVREWPELAVYYKKVKQFYNQITGFLSLALFLIILFSTSNTIIMAVMERTREIGTLLSLGTSRFQVFKSFLFEGFFIGLFGGILSLLFALAVSFFINRLQIILPPAPGQTSGYPLLIRNEWVFFAWVFLATIIVSTLSSFLPALRVTRLKIIKALSD